jgi:hypothetical protein
MANRQTTASRSSNGDLTVQQHETDSPIIPVPQLEKLQTFRPDLVDWVINQTQTEAEHRRAENKRINLFIFIERLVGQIFAFVIGMAAIGVGAYIALNGQPWAGATIAGVAITGLAGIFLIGHKKSSK